MSDAYDPMKPDGEVNPISTDYKIGQDNIVLKMGPLGLDIHNRYNMIHNPTYQEA